MEENNNYFPEDILEHLSIINGINFTHREIDVVACLINVRGTSKIASLLSIAPRTVITHVRNIMLKLECNSRERIIDFIEKAGKTCFLRKHYACLLIRAAFEKRLKEISSIIGKCPSLQYSVLGQDHDFLAPFINCLRNDLATLGVELDQENPNSSDSDCNLPTDKVLICILSQKTAEDFQLDKDVQYLESSPLICNHNTCIFLRVNLDSTLSQCQKGTSLSFESFQNYYFAFFDLLKQIFPSVVFERIINEFKDFYHTTYGDRVEDSVLTNELKIKNTLFEHIRNEVVGTYWTKFITIFFVGIGFCFGFYFLLPSNKESVSSKLSSSNVLIRSDLSVPGDKALLNRPHLLEDIDQKIRSNKGIQSIALVGFGGAGKTTLARQYALQQAQQQKAGVIWEVNAETAETLRLSFEELAQELGPSKEDQKSLHEIQNTKDSVHKEQRIIQFVKDHLRVTPNWLLIFDNVQQFEDIQSYFPQDTEMWGQGKIILTTCNENIGKNSHIDDFLEIGKLTSEEKLNLFTQIMEHGKGQAISQNSLKETKIFLEELPPYPLDVSIAASYLKSTNMSYGEYLKCLNDCNSHFENMLEKRLKEDGNNYSKTRYKIISLSLKHLIETDTDFIDLLLFISLIDSQNIPKDLLQDFKGITVVDDFIYNLRKYFFIIDENSSFTFSIHRVTHKYSLSYLMKELNLQNKTQLLQKITKNIEKYTSTEINKKDILKIKSMIEHCKKFISHDKLLKEDNIKFIRTELGCIYYRYLGDYINAEQLLRKSLVNLKADHNADYKYQIKILVNLGNTYRELGRFEEAKNLLEESLIIHKSNNSKDHEGIAENFADLGYVYRSLGCYKKAKENLEKSLKVYEESLPENLVGKAKTLLYLGAASSSLEDFESAEKFFNQSLKIYENNPSINQVDPARARLYLGSLYKKLGRFKDAKTEIEKAQSLFKEHYGENHIKVGWALYYLANVYEEEGDYKEAKKLLEQSLDIYNGYSKKHVITARVNIYLGNIYRKLGEFEAAQKSFAEGLKIYEKHFSKNILEVARSWEYLGILYKELDNKEESKKALERSLANYEKYISENSTELAEIMHDLGNVYRDLGIYDKAKIYSNKAWERYEKIYKNNRVKIAELLNDLSKLYILGGHIEAAENSAQKALKIFEETKHPDRFISYENLAELNLKKSAQEESKQNIQQAQNFKLQAISYLRRALDIVKTHFPTDSSHLQKIQVKLQKLD